MEIEKFERRKGKEPSPKCLRQIRKIEDGKGSLDQRLREIERVERRLKLLKRRERKIC